MLGLGLGHQQEVRPRNRSWSGSLYAQITGLEVALEKHVWLQQKASPAMLSVLPGGTAAMVLVVCSVLVLFVCLSETR